jgi:glycosyltransferase involved in cell wall biosynthesis
LADAIALINPIHWDEPFGLVMIEALASATPVIAFPEGAAPEIVDDGVTGFLPRDEAEMVQAVGDLGTIDRDACRHSFEERFSAERMVAEYLDLYESVLRKSLDPAGAPA